jgi:hypothetical protein
VGIQVTLQRYDVQILGRAFQFVGQMEPVGRVLDYLNDANRSTFPIYDVKISPVTPGSPLAGITRPEIIVSNDELGLIYFLDPEYRKKVDVLRNFDRVVAYTAHAVLRGNFHRGVETRLGDLFDVMQGSYLALTDVNIVPMTELPAPFPLQADVLIANRAFVDLYHPE